MHTSTKRQCWWQFWNHSNIPHRIGDKKNPTQYEHLFISESHVCFELTRVCEVKPKSNSFVSLPYMCHTTQVHCVTPFFDFVNLLMRSLVQLYLFPRRANIKKRALHELITCKYQVNSCVVFVICFFVTVTHSFFSHKYETIMANVSNESLISYLMFIHLVASTTIRATVILSIYFLCYFVQCMISFWQWISK